MTLTMTSRPGTDNDYLAAARELRPLLREQANAIETARELTRPVLDALIERRLFSVLQPDEGGAPGATLVDVAQILAELARRRRFDGLGRDELDGFVDPGRVPHGGRRPTRVRLAERRGGDGRGQDGQGGRG